MHFRGAQSSASSFLCEEAATWVAARWCLAAGAAALAGWWARGCHDGEREGDDSTMMMMLGGGERCIL